MKSRKKAVWVVSFLAISLMCWLFVSSRREIDFSADVKPILNKKCITCHGGVKAKAGFSLLFREDALAKTESGKAAIIPGKPGQSEMIRRLTLNDPEERMPYRHEPLSKEEIDILKAWIRQGAKWGDHWAYNAVEEPEIPMAKGKFFGLFKPDKPAWVKNEIDYFIDEKLQQQKLTASKEADKATLLRRVSMDLTGVPASKQLADQFLKDHSPEAYEKLVDGLLASPQYGERWTALWMDMARYADTKGYERDPGRSIWRYRDWLIRAFNEDKPYDQFLTEQIAGDLLPNPTDAQYIATAFHRNTMTNDEGGTDNEEFRTAAVIDRVNTTWETLMGTSFSCVQCHSHPYDPFRHEEYYKFMAFFNNTRDEDTFEEYPVLREYTNADSLKFENLVKWLKQNVSQEKSTDITRFLKTGEPAVNSVVADQFNNSALADTKWLTMRNKSGCRLKNVFLNNKTVLMCRYATSFKTGKWTIHLDKPDGPVLTSIQLPATKGWQVAGFSIPAVEGAHDLWLSYANPALKSLDENGAAFSWFYFTEPFPGTNSKGYDSAYSHYMQLANSSMYTATPVLIENTADLYRTSHVFERGNWLVKGKVVTPAVPGSLNDMPANAPANRLGLAMWLTDKKNPLVSRTIVNRIWEQLFGHGIAETLEDLGTQGIAPTHQQLLDWLSWQLMNNYQWSLKKLVKTIVMSATYRQSSVLTKETLEKDPANKFYARGPRTRLTAEQIRDQALAVSGVLNNTMYGHSIMPYQPPGIWQSPYNNDLWKLSDSDAVYRRSLYIYWKRTAPYPFMMMFDGVARDLCVARRIPTNTPLQALVTLNDSGYVDMARHFAYRIQKEVTQDPSKQISKAYEDMMYRSISSQKLKALMELYTQSLAAFKTDKKKTEEFIGASDEHNNPETAALVMVLNSMLNLDEWITKN